MSFVCLIVYSTSSAQALARIFSSRVCQTSLPRSFHEAISSNNLLAPSFTRKQLYLEKRKTWSKLKSKPRSLLHIYNLIDTIRSTDSPPSRWTPTRVDTLLVNALQAMRHQSMHFQLINPSQQSMQSQCSLANAV